MIKDSASEPGIVPKDVNSGPAAEYAVSDKHMDLETKYSNMLEKYPGIRLPWYNAQRLLMSSLDLLQIILSSLHEGEKHLIAAARD